MTVTDHLLRSLMWAAPELVLCVIAVVLIQRNLGDQPRAQGRAFVTFMVFFIATLLGFGHAFIRDRYDREIAASGLSEDSTSANSETRSSDDFERRRAIQDKRFEWHHYLTTSGTVLDSLAFLLLITAIFLERVPKAARTDVEIQSMSFTASLIRIGKVFAWIFGVALAASWLWCVYIQPLGPVSSSGTVVLNVARVACDKLPFLVSLVLGFGMVMFRPNLTRGARQYAFCGASLKTAGFLVSNGLQIFILHTLWDGTSNSESAALARERVNSLNQTISAAAVIIDFVANLFLVAALVTERRPARGIIPRPNMILEDPLFELRRLIRRIGWVAIAIIILSATIIAIRSPTEGSFVLVLWAVAFSIGIWIKSMLMTFMMPNQKPNAVYLRSFRSDPSSYDIRIAIQEALGPRFRLTGIRDPRRRTASVWEYVVGPAIWAFRYCTPKFMDLEAGDDWKVRLWNTLQAGRLAIVDLIDMTPHVHVEIKLATEAIGFERVLFVIDESRSLEEWLQLIRLQTNTKDPRQIQVAYWNPNRPEEFRAKVHSFAMLLPPTSPYRHFATNDYGPAFRTRWIERRAVSFLIVFVAMQCVFGVGVVLLQQIPEIGRLMSATGSGQLRSPVFWTEIAMSLWLLCNLALYAKEVGVKYERRKAVIAFCALSVFMILGRFALAYMEEI